MLNKTANACVQIPDPGNACSPFYRLAEEDAPASDDACGDFADEPFRCFVQTKSRWGITRMPIEISIERLRPPQRILYGFSEYDRSTLGKDIYHAERRIMKHRSSRYSSRGMARVAPKSVLSSQICIRLADETASLPSRRILSEMPPSTSRTMSTMREPVTAKMWK